MVIEKTIANMTEFFEFISSVQYTDKRINRAWCNYFFRGHKQYRYKLESSLHRNSKGNEKIAENRQLVHFKKFAQYHEPMVKNSVWENLIFSQHHGVPTRLLDWSKSPLIAMHFATEHVDSGSHLDDDACIWAIENHQLNALLPKRYKDNMSANNSTICTMDELRKSCENPDHYDDDMGKKGFLIFEPDSIDSRVVNQLSLLSIIPRDLDPLDDYLYNTSGDIITAYRIRLPKNSLERLRDDLDLLGISERMVYPGLDGIAKMLKRQYYHRPK